SCRHFGGSADGVGLQTDVLEDDLRRREERPMIIPGTLAILAQRLGKVCASASMWYNLARKFGWRRPRLRVNYKEGMKTYTLSSGEFGAYRIRDGIARLITTAAAKRRGDPPVSSSTLFADLLRSTNESHDARSKMP